LLIRPGLEAAARGIFKWAAFMRNMQPGVTVPSMRLNKHRHRRNTSDRIYQPDSQDGRKRAKGDDSNFEMKILIQATCLRSLSGVSPWPLANRKNPAALGGDRRADPPITPLQWLTG
jgi:hypothetical protein